MSRRSSSRPHAPPHGRTDLRRRIAVEAARLMTESGLRDFGLAKRKAGARLGVADETGLPTNAEVEDALREHQRLFQADSQPLVLRRLRAAAVEALRFFEPFEPRLVGAVLEGTADAHSAVCLHLHTDDPAEVLIRLREQGADFSQHQRRLRLDATHVLECPVVRFDAGDAPIDLTILPYARLRQAPLDRVDGSPMQRAGLAAVQALLDDPA
jgi:hypothetical protein